MEQTFVDWLEAQGISQGIYGYWEQVHFKHKPEGKTRNGWADFVFVSRRLIIELDGNHHRTRQIQDHMRDAHLRTRGYEVIRITHTEYRRKTKLNLIREKLGM
jgi:very-short-patch-repair endonuclease